MICKRCGSVYSSILGHACPPAWVAIVSTDKLPTEGLLDLRDYSVETEISASDSREAAEIAAQRWHDASAMYSDLTALYVGVMTHEAYYDMEGHEVEPDALAKFFVKIEYAPTYTATRGDEP